MSYGFLRRFSHGARSSVVAEPGASYFGGAIADGWQVEDVQGRPLGTVAGERSGYLIVRRSWLRSPLYVPPESIHQAGQGIVTLNEADGSPGANRWSQPPARRA